MAAAVPIVEGSYDAHPRGIWGPQCEMNTFNTFNFQYMRAELLVFPVMCALGDQVKIIIRKDGPEAVRVVERQGFTLRGFCFYFVFETGTLMFFDSSFKEIGVWNPVH